MLYEKTRAEALLYLKKSLGDYHEIDRLHSSVRKLMDKARREERECHKEDEGNCHNLPTWKIGEEVLRWQDRQGCQRKEE